MTYETWKYYCNQRLVPNAKWDSQNLRVLRPGDRPNHRSDLYEDFLDFPSASLGIALDGSGACMHRNTTALTLSPVKRFCETSVAPLAFMELMG